MHMWVFIPDHELLKPLRVGDGVVVDEGEELRAGVRGPGIARVAQALGAFVGEHGDIWKGGTSALKERVIVVAHEYYLVGRDCLALN
jgi:hypothetical protein